MYISYGVGKLPTDHHIYINESISPNPKPYACVYSVLFRDVFPRSPSIWCPSVLIPMRRLLCLHFSSIVAQECVFHAPFAPLAVRTCNGTASLDQRCSVAHVRRRARRDAHTCRRQREEVGRDSGPFRSGRWRQGFAVGQGASGLPWVFTGVIVD